MTYQLHTFDKSIKVPMNELHKREFTPGVQFDSLGTAINMQSEALFEKYWVKCTVVETGEELEYDNFVGWVRNPYHD